MGFIINPGSEPVTGASLERATENIEALLNDLSWDTTPERNPEGDGRGRFSFNLLVPGSNGLHRTVDMPGIPLERVRWMDRPDQNIWDFPRMYVDGGSWVWKFALGILARSDDEDDES